jgi:hypothetical protein
MTMHIKRKRHWDASRNLLESDCEQLFGMSFGALCKSIGLNTNTGLARIREGIPIHVALRQPNHPQQDDEIITITATKAIEHE